MTGEGDNTVIKVVFSDYGIKKLLPAYAKLQLVESSATGESLQLIDDEADNDDEIDPFADE